MESLELIEQVRRENYPLSIIEAFQNSTTPITGNVTKKLVDQIHEIYRFLEPDHFDGKIVICYPLQDIAHLVPSSGRNMFDKNELLSLSNNPILIEVTGTDTTIRIYESINIDVDALSCFAVVYVYENREEFFIANGTRIPIASYHGSASIYALQYYLLRNALNEYRDKKAKNSTCSHLRDCWFDSGRTYFIAGPEEKMQISLDQHLSSALKGVDVNREFNLNASKPVDIRVLWRNANRNALIELKWLGQSKHPDGRLSTSYSNARAIEGLDQLKEYADLDRTDNPTSITKYWLVALDGRRRGVSIGSNSITNDNALHFRDKELEIPDNKKYFESEKGFEKPLRIFIEPITSRF